MTQATSPTAAWRGLDRRTKFRVVALVLSLLVLPWGTVGLYLYPVILRDGNFSPFVGVPVVMYAVSPLLVALYWAVVFRAFKGVTSIQRRLRASGAIIVLYSIFLCLEILGVAQTLNGMLDFAPVTIQRGVVIDTTLKGKTPYTVLQDWQRPGSHVYIMGAGRYPRGATIIFKTKPGFFGWEWQTV